MPSRDRAGGEGGRPSGLSIRVLHGEMLRPTGQWRRGAGQRGSSVLGRALQRMSRGVIEVIRSRVEDSTRLRCPHFRPSCLRGLPEAGHLTAVCFPVSAEASERLGSLLRWLWSHGPERPRWTSWSWGSCRVLLAAASWSRTSVAPACILCILFQSPLLSRTIPTFRPFGTHTLN